METQWAKEGSPSSQKWTKMFKPTTIDRTPEEIAVFEKFAEVWGPIFKEDPRFGIPIENFLSECRRSLPKPPCFGEDDCSTSRMINCTVASICGG